jgi:DNA-binding LytR/AlgR family response regulator
VGIAEPVMCLQMEDHYVRVHRASGSILELMPLQEAIARFGGAGGLQVHRSWWVAGAAVAGAERDARNWRLRLTNGLIVPLARNRVAEARARGWIGGEPP